MSEVNTDDDEICTLLDVTEQAESRTIFRPEMERRIAFWSGFRTCMPGFTVRLNAPWIRFLLAEALLRLGPNMTASGR